MIRIMQKMTTTRVARKIAEAVRTAQRGPLALTTRGRTVAVLCSPEAWAEQAHLLHTFRFVDGVVEWQKDTYSGPKGNGWYPVEDCNDIIKSEAIDWVARAAGESL